MATSYPVLLPDMDKIKKWTPNILFFLQFFLAFLLLFEKYVSVPVILQPLGRMHPLLLHFPVVLVLLLCGLYFIRKKIEETSYRELHYYLLVLTALTTSFTALMGFFLSMEEGYAPGQMTWHKWTGVGLSFITYGMLLTLHKEKVYRPLMFSSVVFVILSGHFGAEITHGDSFVFAPWKGEEEILLTEHTPIYEGIVAPLFQSKCTSCHNPQKHKGDLDMTSFELLLQGGENGPVWVDGSPEESDIIRRAHLPVEDEDHMPPDGKPQLTALELALLENWIRLGASDTVTLAQLQPADTLFVLVSNIINKPGAVKTKSYTFSYADDQVVASLNNPFRTVRQITSQGPGLEASIFVRQAYQPEYLSGLEAVAEQIVSLNLTNLPVTDQDLATIGKFVNLEKLVLNYSDIEGKNISALKDCQSLEQLSLSGAKLDTDLTSQIEALSSLKELYIWDTGLPAEEIQKLKEKYPALRIEEGFQPNPDEVLKLNPPILGNKRVIIQVGEKLELEHPIPGTSIRYTLDGTVPDSVNGVLYSAPVEVKNIGMIRAFAFKDGWEKSAVATFRYFINGYKPDSAVILTTPTAEYPGMGGETIINNRNAETRAFRSREWIAFSDEPMVAVVVFRKEVPEVTTMTLGYAIMVGRRIMPPTSVELWGGDDTDNMVLLAKDTPEQLERGRGDVETGLEMTFEPATYRYYKIIAHPLKRLPEWHRNKGKKGIISVDEVYFY